VRSAASTEALKLLAVPASAREPPFCPRRARSASCASAGEDRHRPAVVMLARWLNSWPGLGAVVFGMSAQGFNAELKRSP